MILLLAFPTEADRDRFELLYRRYKNLMMQRAYEILCDYMLAEDAVSEAFLRVYKNLHKVDDPEPGRTAAFLVTIARNCALTLLKKKRNEYADDFAEDIPDGGEMEMTVLSEISSESIYALLGELDEELRNIFVLKFAYDLSHRDIAASLGLSENNVTVKLHRAKKKIAAMLVEVGYIDAKE